MANGGSPVTVGFGGFVAGQAPHVLDHEGRSFVGFPRQRREPVQGHEGEKACIVHRVLMPVTQ